MKKSISFILVAVMVLCMLPSVAMAAGYVTVNTDTTQYATLEAAIAAVKATNGGDGSATYHIYGRIDVGRAVVTGGFNGAGTSTFIGETADAQIVVNPPAPGTGTPQATSEGDSYGSVTAVTFKNLKFTTNDVDYKGFHHSTKEVFENCTIEGAYWTYAPEVYFKECTFIQDDSTGNAYCLRVYGGPTETTVEDCTFYSTHKFILIYREGHGCLDVKVSDSKFILENPASTLKKSAIEMDALYISDGIVLTVTNNKVDTDIAKNVDGKEKLYFDKTPDQGGPVTVTADGNVVTKDFSDPVSVPESPAPKPSGSGYYGPDVWYIGGNTFGTNTNQVPTSVEIDNVPVSFTMNGNQITVGCIQPGSDWVTVRWGSVSNQRSFTPDANAYCTQTVIPKTGDVSFWAAITEFFGF